MKTENNVKAVNPNNMSVVERVKAPTPKFFKILRAIGLGLAAVGVQYWPPLLRFPQHWLRLLVTLHWRAV
ncbi:MAG TPA: hypothetical protein VI413_07235 [Paludibacter sp.]